MFLKIGVISDTHGRLGQMKSIVEAMSGVELILHAGDFYEDSKRISDATGIRVVGVVGNCDYLVKGPTEELLSVAGKRIYLSHGHIYHVKKEYSLLVERSKSLDADIAVFGHTHTPVIFEKKGILFLNPGSLHAPRKGYQPSCAILEVSKTSTKATHILLP